MLRLKEALLCGVIYREEPSAPPSCLSGPSRLRTSHLYQHFPLLGEGLESHFKGGIQWLICTFCNILRRRRRRYYSFALPYVPAQAESSKNKVVLVKEALCKLSKQQYSIDELTRKPLPEGVDPLRLEDYLSDQDFQVGRKIYLLLLDH